MASLGNKKKISEKDSRKNGGKKKKSMLKKIQSMVGREQSNKMSPKKAEVVNHIHTLLLNEEYDEVDRYFEENKKLFHRKLKKNEVPLTAFQITDEAGETILLKAIKAGKTKQVLGWIEIQAVDLNIPDNEGYTALMVAVLAGEEDIVKKIVGSANKDAKTIDSNKTALHLAAEQGHFGLCEILLESGCNPLLEDYEGKRAFEYSDNAEIRDLLVKTMKQQDPNVAL